MTATDLTLSAGETHYFIMTVEPEVLAEHGVLRNGSLKGKARLQTAQCCAVHSVIFRSFFCAGGQDLLSVENVDMKKLEDTGCRSCRQVDAPDLCSTLISCAICAAA